MTEFQNFHALYKYVLHSCPDPNEESVVGFIYYDKEAGVSENIEGHCRLIDNELTFTKNYFKDEKSRWVLRLSENTGRDFYILNKKRIAELELPIRPDWLDAYSKQHEEYLRALEFLHPFRCPNFPDDVQVLLPPDTDRQYEIVWVRLLKMKNDTAFEGLLLNEPNQNFRVHENTQITVIPLFDETNKSFFLICKESMNSSPVFLEWLKNKVNAFEAYRKMQVNADLLIKEKENNTQGWMEKAAGCMDFYQYESTIDCYDQALKIRPDYFDALEGKLFSIIHLGRYDEALGIIDSVLRINPRSVYMLSNKGGLLMKLGRIEEALTWYESAIGIEPKNPNLLINKGMGLMNLEQYNDAIDTFNEIITINPSSSEAWCKKAKSYLHMNRFDDAIMCFDTALSFDPDNLEAQEWKEKAIAAKNS